MIRIAVVDDEKQDLLYLRKKIENCFECRNIKYSFSLYMNAKDFMRDFEKENFDVIFLDIDMPETTGMEVAEKLNEFQGKSQIIFVTNHDELVYKAYRFKALGFIRKSFFEQEIDETIDIILQEFKRNNFKLNINGLPYDTTVEDIKYIKSDDHYIEFYLINGKKCIRATLKEIEKRVEHYGFIKIHSRYIVNYRYVYSIENKVILLTDNTQLPISRSNLAKTKERLQFFSRRI